MYFKVTQLFIICWSQMMFTCPSKNTCLKRNWWNLFSPWNSIFQSGLIVFFYSPIIVFGIKQMCLPGLTGLYPMRLEILLELSYPYPRHIKFMFDFPQVCIAYWIVAPLLANNILRLEYSTTKRQGFAHALYPEIGVRMNIHLKTISLFVTHVF